jgi:hypothetical protein
MKIENRKITAQCWARISARGSALLAWPNSLGAARLAGTPRGSDDGCTRQGGAAGFTLEMAGGGGAEKTAQRGDVPRRRRSSCGRGGHRRVLQLDGGAVELTEGGGETMAQQR